MNNMYYSSKSNNFNFIRFVAACLVVVTHSFDLMAIAEKEPLFSLTDGRAALSYLGVRTFFIISGFLITQSIINSSSYISYLQKRILRIFPGLILVVVLMIVLYGPLFTVNPLADYFTDPNTYSYLKNILLIRSQASLPGVFIDHKDIWLNGSLWTLVYEFSFYLILMVVSIFGLFKKPVLLAIAFTFILVADVGLHERPDLSKGYYQSVNMELGSFVELSLFFLSGCLCFIYRQTIPYRKNIFYAVLFVWLVIILVNPFSVFRSATYILLPYIVMCLSFWESPLNKFGRSSDYSYGLYIYAFPIQQALINNKALTIHSPWLIVLLTYVILVPFVWMSWHWVEAPFLRFKNRIPQKQLTKI